jgi:hypothetical protein
MRCHHLTSIFASHSLQEPLGDMMDDDNVDINDGDDDDALDLTVDSTNDPPTTAEATPVVDKASAELHKSLAKAFSTAWLEFLKLEVRDVVGWVGCGWMACI